MMKKYFLGILFVLPGLMIAQRFEPYSSFGIQANLNLGGLQRGECDGLGPHLAEFIIQYEILGMYDYAPFKWLGVTCGLGLSTRGGEGRDLTPSNFYVPSPTKKVLYYANIPVRLQFKAGFFWLEPGIDNLFFIGLNDHTDYSLDVPYSLEKDAVPLYQLAGHMSGRFNLFRGLSLNLGASMNFTPVANVSNPQIPDKHECYENRLFFIGVRYMFDQPYK